MKFQISKKSLGAVLFALMLAVPLLLPSPTRAEFDCGPGYRTVSHKLITDTSFVLEPTQNSCVPLPYGDARFLRFDGGLIGGGGLAPQSYTTSNTLGCGDPFSKQLTITWGGPPVSFARVFLLGNLDNLIVSDGFPIIHDPVSGKNYIEPKNVSTLTITAIGSEWFFGIYDLDWTWCFPAATPSPTPTPTPTPSPTPSPTPDDARNLGEACPKEMVGKPVNVTSGNVYLKQTDYHLPGFGEAISIVRSYNSKGTRFGLFGPAWSSTYDEGLSMDFDHNTARLFMPDGRATDFAGDGSGLFTPRQPDFFGHLNQNQD